METKVKAKKTASKKVVKPKKTAMKSPTFEQIQERAYQIYLEKGRKSNDLENWLQAEKELNI